MGVVQIIVQTQMALIFVLVQMGFNYNGTSKLAKVIK